MPSFTTSVSEGLIAAVESSQSVPAVPPAGAVVEPQSSASPSAMQAVVELLGAAPGNVVATLSAQSVPAVPPAGADVEPQLSPSASAMQAVVELLGAAP